jgi:hypothetical protein
MPDKGKKIERGSLVTLIYESREFKAVVIDPDGLGDGQPSVGFGFRMAERYAGIPQPTLSGWVIGSEDDKSLKLPSEKLFRVIEILASDGNTYSVVEASDWFSIAVDLLVNPGRTGKGLAGKGLRTKLGDFIAWFAVKGFYAEAYVALRGVYTAKDSRATTQWLESRQLGKVARKLYTDLLQAEEGEDCDYAGWTNYVYQGLFGLKASKMREIWELMEGDPKIARNYIPKAEGLDAVKYCEDMVVRVFVDDLTEAHDTAISLTKRKFLAGG